MNAATDRAVRQSFRFRDAIEMGCGDHALCAAMLAYEDDGARFIRFRTNGQIRGDQKNCKDRYFSLCNQCASPEPWPACLPSCSSAALKPVASLSTDPVPQ